MNEYKIYCGGEFITSPEVHNVTNKYSGEIFATTFLADEQILEKAIKSGQQALAECRNLSSLEKYRALSFISVELEKNLTELAKVLSMESGKPIIYARAEIARSVITFQVAAEEARRLPKEYISLDWTENGRNREGLVKYFPAGVVAGISPFNYPMNLAVHKIAPAIAAGCPIILKPASDTPLSTLLLAVIISRAGLPKGSVSILPMSRKTGNLLVTDERISLLSFTGSPVIGWELKKQSGKKKVVLELGGNAGVIISQKVNLKEIIKKCVTGAFSYSGQICIHAQRFFVHASLYDEFIKMMREEALKITNADPLDESTLMSVMIDRENAERVEKWVQEAVEAGAEIVCGAQHQGSYYHPTILTGTSPKMKVRCEEVFGPVVCIEKYEGHISTAISLINDSRFGLQCGIFTDSVMELDEVFASVDAGGIIHNDVPTLRFDQMPYGGIKESGLGREGVKYAIMDMLEAKVLVK